MSMNGCRGAGSRPNNMYIECFNQCRLDIQSSECKECTEAYSRTYDDEAIGTPSPRLGVCGDLWDRNAFSTNFSDATCERLGGDGSCVEQALRADFSKVTLDEDNAFTLQLQITAHHWGWSEFRLCRDGASPGGVTQECFNNDVLSFDVEDARSRYGRNMSAEPVDLTADPPYVPKDPSDYSGTAPGRRCNGVDHEPLRAALKEEYPHLWSPDGSCCLGGGRCVAPDAINQSQRWVLPAPGALEDAGACEDCPPPPTGATSVNGFYYVRVFLPSGLACTRSRPCTLQWLYMTGNSPDSYPEAFRNCADFELTSTTPTTQAALRGYASTSRP